MGCRASVTTKGRDRIRVDNVECQRGREYAANELKAPKRDFFTTVRVTGGKIPICPVRTTRPIPKERIGESNHALAKVVLQAPIRAGQTIAKNFLGLGVDVIATRDLEELSEVD
jgi:CxxC motif-containing protein